MNYLVGVDVGGTNIVCGVLDLEGHILDTLKEPTEASTGSIQVIQNIHRMIETVLLRQNISLEQVLAVGLGIPGFVDPLKGIAVLAVNLNWTQVPIAELLAQQLNLPVFVDNDVRMYVLGEALKGAGQDYDHVLGVTVGTGLASAMVNHGRLYYGGSFMAGEMGHTPIEGVDQKCACGLIGCLEIFVSAPGMVRQAQRLISERNESILQACNYNSAKISANEISKAYDLGDSVAIQIFKQTGKLLARGLANAIPILSPDVIVIGGGVAFAGERLLAPLRRELANLVYPDYLQRIEIKTAAWINEAGVIGSALYAKQRVQHLQ